MRALYWFRNNLRLDDNPSLLSAVNEAESILFIYIKQRFRPWCNLKGEGIQRERFQTESLIALQSELSQHGHTLLVLPGSPELVIPGMIDQYKIDCIYTDTCPGVYEERAINFLTKKTSIVIKNQHTQSLFSEHDISQTCGTLPDTFSPFRRKVEKNLKPIPPVPAPPNFPNPLVVNNDRIFAVSNTPNMALPIRGGHIAGMRRLQQFLQENGGIRQYKETRNQLDPLGGTSTLSPWLGNGSLSVRSVAQAISQHEQAFGANDSTYWLYFELLWREYFHWKALEDPQALFRYGGRHNNPPLKTFNARQFSRWCAG